MEFVAVIVEEVISDVSLYTQEKMLEVIDSISNKRQFCDEPEGQQKDDEKLSYYLRAPRNSIIGRLKSAGKDGKPGDSEFLKVYYPFFSSHFTLPVKPGEIVWAFDAGEESFWVTRVHTPLHVEDSNFTHLDRSNIPVRQPPIVTPEDSIKEGVFPRQPNFPDGNSHKTIESDKRDQTEEDIKKVDPAERTFQRSEEDVPGNTHYESIYVNNNESSRVVYEPVPTFTKRPGDLVLQGSNNTTIVLGIDRGYSKSADPADRPNGTTTNASQETQERAGTIDIVAGRGRFLPADTMEDVSDKKPKDQTTQPRVIKNIRDKYETDKNLGLDDGKAADGYNLVDVSEGDPDFLYDASRIYVSMQTNPDKMLGLEGNLSKTVVANSTDNAGSDVSAVSNAAAVVLKSDEIRIVSRQEKGSGSEAEPEINGSIKIVKEGVADSRSGNGRAVIMIQPDGTIVIDGPKIVIGSGAKVAEDDHGGVGGGSQVSMGLAAQESMVLGNELLKRLIKLEEKFNNHIHGTGTGPSTTHDQAIPAATLSKEFTQAIPGETSSGDETAAAVPGRVILSKLGKLL